MDNIIEPTMDYDFSKLYLGPPSTLTGGSYFTKIMYGTNEPLYIQTPKCLTKQGFVKNGKKMYVDLMFDNNDTVFINWMENLESRCQELLLQKSNIWFEGKLEKDDVETAFTSVFKIFKSGKYYLMRANVRQTIKIYNEMHEILASENIDTNNTIISILEIQGIKFTSRNFQIEIEVKQSVVVSPDPFLDKCFIRIPKSGSQLPSQKVLSEPESVETIISPNQEQKIDLELNNLDDIVDNTNNTDNIDDFIKETVNELSSTTSNVIETTNTIEDGNIVEESNTIQDSNTTQSINKNNIGQLDLNVDMNMDLDLENNDQILKEVELTIDNNLEEITLKKPTDVYHEIYKRAREKAKEAKHIALQAYLELKNIKRKYMIQDDDDDMDDMDDDDYNDDNYNDDNMDDSNN